MADELPWCDCKVAYGIDDMDKFERWMDRTDDGSGLLPAGWSLCETDGAGARYVAVFRVEGALTAHDGTAVRRLLAKVGGERMPRINPKRRSGLRARFSAINPE